MKADAWVLFTFVDMQTSLEKALKARCKEHYTCGSGPEGTGSKKPVGMTFAAFLAQIKRKDADFHSRVMEQNSGLGD